MSTFRMPITWTVVTVKIRFKAVIFLLVFTEKSPLHSKTGLASFFFREVGGN